MQRDETLQAVINAVQKARNDLVAAHDGVRDASINADGPMQSTYDTTKKEQGWLANAMSKRVGELDGLLSQLRLVQKGFSDGNGVGGVFRLQFDDEAEPIDCMLLPDRNVPSIEELNVTLISVSSPLGKAIGAARTGDTVSFSTPGGQRKVTVLDCSL